jgi:hypothetical protein
MNRSKRVFAIGWLLVSAAACGDATSFTAAGSGELGSEKRTAGLSAAARPRPPATPTVLATADDQQFLVGLLLSGSNVRFGAGRSVTLPPGSTPASEMVGVLRSVPVSGGAVTELWTGNGVVDDIAPASDALLFVAYDFFARTGHLNRIPASGGAAVELASWFSHGSTQSVTSEADVAYWTHSAGAGTFVKRTTTDGATVTLADSQTINGSSADDIVIKDGVLYFVATQAERAVMGVPADGSAPPSVLFTAAQIDALAVALPSPY